jgi:hypothetical protein
MVRVANVVKIDQATLPYFGSVTQMNTLAIGKEKKSE